MENCTGVNIGGMNINNIRYADDTVLLAENQAYLQKLVDIVHTFYLTWYNMMMNTKKTKQW